MGVNYKRIMNLRFVLLICVVVIIFGILLYSDWIQSILLLNPNALDRTVHHKQEKNTVRHTDIPKLQPVPKDLKLFSLAMSESEMGVLLTILEVFTHTMDKYNITYVMDGGSLLATYRHHGPIRWDDDLDVMADIHQKETVKKTLKSLSPEYVMIEWDHRLKLYSRDGSRQTFNDKAWRWPFLDIFWFKDNGTYIHDIFKGNLLKKKDFYPLQKRPFGYLNVSTPCNVSAKLKVNRIDFNMCVSSAYNHMGEIWAREGQISIHCKTLQKYYPFVRRVFYHDVTVEYLEANNRTISVFEKHKCY